MKQLITRLGRGLCICVALSASPSFAGAGASWQIGPLVIGFTPTAAGSTFAFLSSSSLGGSVETELGIESVNTFPASTSFYTQTTQPTGTGGFASFTYRGPTSAAEIKGVASAPAWIGYTTRAESTLTAGFQYQITGAGTLSVQVPTLIAGAVTSAGGLGYAAVRATNSFTSGAFSESRDLSTNVSADESAGSAGVSQPHTFDLSFSTPGAGSGAFGFYADAIAYQPALVAAVPEPSTYALMLAGLGVVGFVARRKKREEARR